MGMFKDMKNTVAAAPGMIDQAQQMQAQAQQMQAQQAGMMNQPINPADVEEIEGISLERYAALSKAVGTRQLSGDALNEFMTAQGHTPEAWQAAYDGWNARFKNNMSLSTQYGMLYQQAPNL